VTLEIPSLPKNTILLLEVGSTAHGTGQEGMEDHDEMGVVIETPEEVFGLTDGFASVMQRTQPEGERSGPGDTDRTLYSLRKFLRLAASGNPSILMAFWAPVLEIKPLGQELRWLGKSLIGRHMIPRYRGYMKSQAERLLGVRGHSGHGKRGGGMRTELIEKYGYDTKYAMHTARLGFQCMELLTTNQLELPMMGEEGDWLRAVRNGDVSFNEWWVQTLNLDETLGKWLTDVTVPAGPDYHRIQSWSASAHMRAWDPAQKSAT
jgi:hypothetical protein